MILLQKMSFDRLFKSLITGVILLSMIMFVARMASLFDADYRWVQAAWAEEATPSTKADAAPAKDTTQTTEKTENKKETASLAVREGQTDFAKPTKTDEDLVDITQFSKSEIELLQSLRQRRDLIDKKAEDVDQRERTVAALEVTLDAKLKAMEAIKTDIEGVYKNIEAKAADLRKAEDEQIATLVRIYEKMKPESAAAIMNNLDLTILLDVVRGMKEAKLAPILSKMDVKKATFVTAELAKRTPVPEDATKLMASMNETKPQGKKETGK